MCIICFSKFLDKYEGVFTKKEPWIYQIVLLYIGLEVLLLVFIHIENKSMIGWIT
jgi:hypothetical protein